MKSLIKATFIVTIFSIVTRALSFIYRIYISRMIGSDGMGLYQIALSVFSVLITITSSGIPITVSKQTAMHIYKGDKKAEFSTVTAALVVGFIFSTVLSAILYFMRDYFSLIFIDKRCNSIFTLLLPAVIASSMYSAFRGGLWGQRRYLSYSTVEFMEEVFMVIAGVLLLQGVVTLLGGAQSAALSITISYIGASLLTVLLYFANGGKLKNPKGYFKPLLKTALPITGIRLVSTISQTLIAIILPTILARYVGTESAISIYGTMLGMTFPLLFLPSTLIGSVALVLVPELSSQKESGESGNMSQNIQRALKFTIFISFLIVPIYLALGVPICEVIYKNSIAGRYLQFATIMIVPMGCSQICSSILSSLGYEKQTFKNSLIGCSIILLSVIILPKFFSIYSIIIGYFISLITTCTLNLTILKKKINFDLGFFKQIFVYVLFCIPPFILAYTLNNVLAIFIGGILSIMVSSFVCLVMYTLLLYMFKIIDFSYLSLSHKK